MSSSKKKSTSSNGGNAPKGVQMDRMIDMEIENGQYGFIDIQKKDKFKKFYDLMEEDYVFQIENLPEAFAKLEEEEPQSLEQQKQKEILMSNKNAKQLMLEQFVNPDYLEFDIETGYFGELNSSFKSSGDDIQRNYLKKMQEILDGKEQLRLKKDKYELRALSKLVNTYKILEKEDDR